MERVTRSCVQTILKILNGGICMVGLAMILYDFWLIHMWQRQFGDFPFDFNHNPHDHAPFPWFIYSFLSIGITVCVIACLGHVAASTANGCCLYLYTLLTVMLVMLEGGMTADVFLNHDWQEDFPEDPSGSFNQFKDFISSNSNFCKQIGLSVVSVQVLSFLMAMILKALGPHRYDDSSDDCERAPLLSNAVYQSPYVLGSPVAGSRNDAWSIRISDKLRSQGSR